MATTAADLSSSDESEDMPIWNIVRGRAGASQQRANGGISANDGDVKAVQPWAQCDRCNKWRRVQREPGADSFFCDMVQKSCGRPEDAESSSEDDPVRSTRGRSQRRRQRQVGRPANGKRPRKGRQQTAKGSARKHMRAKVEEAVDMAEPRAIVDVPPERDTSEPFASADNDSSDSGGWSAPLKRHDMTLEEYDEWVEAIHTAADAFEKDLDPSRGERRGPLSRALAPGAALSGDFVLNHDVAPTHGATKAVLSTQSFQLSKGGLRVRKGFLKLVEEERQRCNLPTPWLRGIFLAERADRGAYLCQYEGREMDKQTLLAQNRSEKKTTHVLMIGNRYIDASDVDKYPHGLLNTNPSGPCTCVWGSTKFESFQKNAPRRSARNVFMAKSYPSGTMLTIDYGSKDDYCTEGFVKIESEPTNEEWLLAHARLYRASRRVNGLAPPKKRVRKKKKRGPTKKQQQLKSDEELARQLQFGMRQRRVRS